jgi:ubiquitin-protein ligase
MLEFLGTVNERFQVTLLPPAFKNTSINPNIKQEVKIVVRSNYPADPPGLYFMNDVISVNDVEYDWV